MAGSPAEFHFATWQARRERALPSFLVSLAIHAAVVAAIWTVNPRSTLREFRAPTITEILVEEERQVTWYAPKTAMPEVAPVETPSEEAKAETPRYKAPQPIQANAPDAASDKQLIVSDAPEIEFQQDQELPNMLSWQAPKVERPRFQLKAPRLQAPPRPKKIERPEPPKIEPAANAGVDVSQFSQIARLRYRSRNPEQAAPEQAALPADEAPKIDAAPAAPEVDVSRLQQLSRLRFQRDLQQKQAPSQRALDAEEAPRIEAAPTTPDVDASRFQQLSKLRYQQRQQQPQGPAQQALSADGAPVLRDAPGEPGLDPSEFQKLSKLRYQAGDRGRASAGPSQRALGEVADAPAPEIGGAPAGAAAVDVASLQQDTPRLRYQGPAGGRPAGPAPGARALGEVAGEAAPAVGGAPGPAGDALEVAKLDLPGAPPPSLGDPGGDQTGGTGGPVNMVVAGVNPADRAPRELPRGSRSGAFSAGPNATPDGGRTASRGSSSGLRAPNLSIQGPPAGGDAPGDGVDVLRRLTRSGDFERLQPGEAPKIEARIERPKIDPERPFVGRPVYTLAINMPNVTSYRGDWVIQFAEALTEEQRNKETEEERAERLAKKDDSLTPPYPVVKVDPKYSPDAVREEIEGEVVLYCVIRETGQMTNLELVQSLDPRLDASAREALAKWKFEPARKKGLPIAVETLVRIPFRLNPDIKIRY